MPIYQTGHMFDFVSGISSNAIKDVQVLKGSIPSLYGGRISSVINISSKAGDSNNGHGALYGNLMSQGLSVEIPLSKRGSYIINLRQSNPSGGYSKLYNSIQKILALPKNTQLYLCHDYKAPGRDEYCWKTTVSEQRLSNVHVGGGKTESEFVKFRTERDRKLGMPKLIIPSIQVNMRAGNLPPKEDDGEHYLKIPINRI